MKTGPRTSQAAAEGAIETVQVPPYLDDAATACRADSVDRWRLTLDGLLGQAWPQPAPIPGRVHVAVDEPLTDDERAEVLADPSVTHADAARMLAVTPQRVAQLRLKLDSTRPAAPACGASSSLPAEGTVHVEHHNPL